MIMETFDRIMDEIIRGIAIGTCLFFAGIVFVAISKLMGA
jgi:hypothetical protein